EANEEGYFPQEDEAPLGPDEGELLVLRRMLHAQEDPLNTQQRELIFQTRCTVLGKVCNLIIDGGSCTNVISSQAVEKLSLPTCSHPKPYSLKWLNDQEDLKVTKRALVSFSIGDKYKDEVLCDVVPMTACHLLLGRPWQFDRRVIHDGFANTHSLLYNNKRVIL